MLATARVGINPIIIIIIIIIIILLLLLLSSLLLLLLLSSSLLFNLDLIRFTKVYYFFIFVNLS